MLTVTSIGARTSPARVHPPTRPSFRIGAVQQRWHSDPAVHLEQLRASGRIAAELGAAGEY